MKQKINNHQNDYNRSIYYNIPIPSSISKMSQKFHFLATLLAIIALYNEGTVAGPIVTKVSQQSSELVMTKFVVFLFSKDA